MRIRRTRTRFRWSCSDRPGNWAAGVRRGEVVVSNGPLLEFSVEGHGPGATVGWESGSRVVEGAATAVFHRPIEKVEIVANGKVVAARAGNGKDLELTLRFKVPLAESTWMAARTKAPNEPGEPELWAHSNPVYVLQERRPVFVPEARAALAGRWEQEAEYFHSPELTFASEARRKEMLSRVEQALEALRRPPSR